MIADGGTSRAFRNEPAARVGGNVAPLDGANAETINFRKTRFWTGMAASKRQAVGIQEICRVSVQAVIGSGITELLRIVADPTSGCQRLPARALQRAVLSYSLSRSRFWSSIR